VKNATVELMPIAGDKQKCLKDAATSILFSAHFFQQNESLVQTMRFSLGCENTWPYKSTNWQNKWLPI